MNGNNVGDNEDADRLEPDAVVLTKIEIRQALLNEVEELGESHPGRSAQELLCLSFDGKETVPVAAFLETVFTKTGLGGELDADQRHRLVGLLADNRSQPGDFGAQSGARHRHSTAVDMGSFYFQLKRELSDRELCEVARELQSWIDEEEEEEKDDDDGVGGGGTDGGGVSAGDGHTNNCDVAAARAPAYLARIDGDGGFVDKMEDLGFDYGLSDHENQRLFEIMRRWASRPAGARPAAAVPSADPGAASTNAAKDAPSTLAHTGDTTDDTSEEDEESDADVLADLDAKMHSGSGAREPQGPKGAQPVCTAAAATAAVAAGASAPAQSPKPLVPLEHLTILQAYLLLRAHEDVRDAAAGFRDLQFDGRMLSEVTAADIDEIADMNDSTGDAAARISQPLRATREQLVQRILEWRQHGVNSEIVHFSVSNEWAIQETANDVEIVVDPVHRDMIKTLGNMLHDIDDLYYFRDSIENVMRSIALNNFTQAEAERGLLASLRNSFKSRTVPKPNK